MNEPLRILHVVGGMNRGGAETWLMHVLRNTDRKRYQMDFLVHTVEKCAYDDEIRSLGSSIIPCENPSRLTRYVRRFRRILRDRGPYDVVHSHVHHFSGVTLWAAAREKVPGRIAHSHSNTHRIEVGAGLARQTYLKVMEAAISRYATGGIGCSHGAAGSLFGTDWQEDARHQIIYCGIDPVAFRQQVDATTLRREMGISEDVFVIGHVGRFTPVKNHDFIVDIAAALVQERKDVHFLLVGDGPLRPTIERKVESLGLTRHFTFTGMRDDVPRLMMGAIDLFVMPSVYEGLPLVGIEAQAAGVPLLLSDGVTDELDLAPCQVRRLSLSAGANAWSAMIQGWGVMAAESDSPWSSILTGSRFDISRGVVQINEMYEAVSNRSAATTSK